MKVTWVNPCFREYRVPVYAALDRLLGNQLSIVFSEDRTGESVSRKIRDVLGKRAVGLRGEHRLNLGAHHNNFSNVGLRIPYQRGLYKQIASTQPDVLISEGFFQWTPASLWFKRRKGVPLVIAYERTAHTERNAGFLRTSFRRFVAGQADAVICNGILSKLYCSDHLKIPASQIVTGGMAADSESLASRAENHCQENSRILSLVHHLQKPVFLYLGRLIRLKGLRELLKAWSVYEQKESNPGTLWIVGDGPERNAIEETIRHRKLSHVILSNAVDYDDVPAVFTLADILVMPTLEDNWSLVTPEAMSCGLPILCSKYNGCWPELVHEGRNGWIFDPHREEEFASLLLEVHREFDRLADMGRESKILVKDFSPAHAAEAVLKACRIGAGERLKAA